MEATATNTATIKEVPVITKDMGINDILNVDFEISDVLMQIGMHCVGCMAAANESLEEACEVHMLDADKVTELINAYLAQKAVQEA